MGQRARREHLFVETDGQVYLIRDHGNLRFPRAGEKLPFLTEPNGVMDFGTDRVLRQKPRLDHHPEEWLGWDASLERAGVDRVVKRVICTNVIRIGCELIRSYGH